ncbi:MAG: hypothetical protein AAF182_03310 [Pseudomonadota bacterium]
MLSAPVKFISLVISGQVFKSLRPSDKLVSGCAEREVNFRDQQIELPTNHALKGLYSFVRELIIGQEKTIGQINMNKCQGHGVAADNPTAMRNEVFIAGGLIGQKAQNKPHSGHGGETNIGLADFMCRGDRQNGNSTDDAAEDIALTKLTVNVRFFLAQFMTQQKGAKNNSGNCGDNMHYEQKVIKDEIFLKELRCKGFVLINSWLKQVFQRYKQNNKASCRNNMNGPSHLLNVVKGLVTHMQKMNDGTKKMLHKFNYNPFLTNLKSIA